MQGFIKRNIGWLISLTAVIILCLALLLLLINRQNQSIASQLKSEEHNRELTAQIENQEKEITGLCARVEYLKEEKANLETRLSDYDFLNTYDVIILDRSLPRDLLDTVFTYYKSIDEKDFETYQSVTMNDFMLSLYEEVWKNQNAIPNKGDGIKSIVTVASDAENKSDLEDVSFDGNIVLMVNMGFPNAELLYLTKENGAWYVWDTD